MKIAVLYDGSINSHKALKYGLMKIREEGGSIAALHVFQSSMFIDYGAGPRAEEIARAESTHLLNEAKTIISDFGNDLEAQVMQLEGDPEEEVRRFAGDEGIDLIIAPPRFRSLTKKAPCPVSIIPGIIIVPVDNTDSYKLSVQKASAEAANAYSEILLAGIVPVNLYGKYEKKELEALKKNVSENLERAKRILAEKGIGSKDIIRSGYPDEEIMKLAEASPVAMIIIPGDGAEPSELGKAASILNDESGFNRPILIAQDAGKA